MYVKFGDVSLKSNELKKDLATAGAIFSGNTALLTQVAADQLSQKLGNAQRQGLVAISETPPASKVEIPARVQNSEPITVQIGKQVVIYNQTPLPLKYALNDEVFELPSGDGSKHFSRTGEFFLQFDNDLDGDFNIARYYLKGHEYGLLVENSDSFIAIKRYK